MEFFERLMEGLMPACLTFGPLFLVIAGKTPKAERFLRYAGAIMVSVALVTGWWTVQRQRGEMSLLQQRIDYLEQKVPPGRK